MINPQLIDHDAEVNFLGSLLKDGSLLEAYELQHNDFYDERHKYIVKAMNALKTESEAFDSIALSTWLGEKQLLDKVGFTYISEIKASVPTAANAAFYYKIVQRKAKKRKAYNMAVKLQNKLIEADDEEVDELLANGAKWLQNGIQGKSGGFVHIRDLMTEVIEDAQEEKDAIIGIPSGFGDLDVMTGGWKGGEFVVIGARPSMGKTAFALNLTSYAGQAGALVAVYSLEMKRLSLGQRLASAESNVNSRNLKIGANAMNADDWNKLMRGAGILSNTDIYINDVSGVTISGIEKDMRQMRKENPDREILIFIDYLTLIQGDSKHGGNRLQEISDISRRLKLLALELDIAVVALSQLSRAVEQRQDKRPVLSDLRESGQIEQDADVIGFLYRDDYYDKESDTQGITEVIIAKQRDGAVGTVQLAFVKEYSKFVNLARSI